MSDVTQNFPNNQDEISFIIEKDLCTVKNYIEDNRGLIIINNEIDFTNIWKMIMNINFTSVFILNKTKIAVKF